MKNVAIPMGMLSRKNHRHDAYSVRMPATNGPSAEPMRPTPDQMPSALARSLGHEGVVHDRDRGDEDRAAAESLDDPRADQEDVAVRGGAEAPTRRRTGRCRRAPPCGVPRCRRSDRWRSWGRRTRAGRRSSVQSRVSVDGAEVLADLGAARPSARRSRACSAIITPDIAMTVHHLRFDPEIRVLMGDRA